MIHELVVAELIFVVVTPPVVSRAFFNQASTCFNCIPPNEITHMLVLLLFLVLSL